MGFLGDFFKPSKDTATKTTDTSSQLTPFGAFQPAFQSLGQSISGAAGQDPRSFIAGFNPDQQQAFQNIRGGANQNIQGAQQALAGGLGFQNPFTAQQGTFANEALASGLPGLQATAAGQGFQDPSQAIQGALNPAFERFQQDTIPGIASAFSQGGRLRGGDTAGANAAARASGAFGRGVADTSGVLALQARQQQQAQQQAAQTQLTQSGFSNLGFAGQGARGDVATQFGGLDRLGAPAQGQQALLGIGGQQQAQRQAELNAPFSVGAQVNQFAPTAAQFGQRTGNTTVEEEMFGPSPFELAAGGALGIGSLFAGGPGGAASAAQGFKSFFG